MPTTVKIVLIFNAQAGYGWSEQHYLLEASSAPPLAADITYVLNTICPPRALLLGNDCAITGLRASYKVAGGIASKSADAYFPGTPNQVTASQNDSIATVMQDITATRHKVIHLRGAWDVVIESEHYQPNNGGPAWNTAMNAYLAALTALPYGWLGKNTAASSFGTVVSYAQNTDDTITFTLLNDTTSQPLPAVGTVISVRFSKLNSGTSILNKTIVCTVASPTTVTSNNPLAAGPFTGKGRFNAVVSAFIGYNAVSRQSLGERRMGRPLQRYPGRGRRRPVR